LYLNNQVRGKSVSTGKAPANEGSGQFGSQVTALRIDFVTRPGDTNEIAPDLGDLLAQAGLDQEGLVASMVLVSDRETRLVTLLALWDAPRFEASRDRLTALTIKLVAPFADKQPRAHTSFAHLFLPPASSKLTLSDLRPSEIAELVEILAAG
jgi:hypothetical protein